MNLIVNILLLAVAYPAIALSTVYLTSLTSTDPIAIWPAAGIAIGTLIVWGPRVWPGIFAGAMLFNLLSPGGADGNDLLVSGLINGTGASIQALLAAWLARPMLEQPIKLANASYLFRFLITVGPLACLVSASICVPGFTWFGLMEAEFMTKHWLYWWVGDSIGTLLVVPVFLMLDSRFGRNGMRLILQVGILMLIVGSLLVTSDLMYYRAQNASIRASVAENASQLADHVEQRLEVEKDMLKVVGRYFSASDQVSISEFRIFVSEITRRQAVDAMGWLPRVTNPQRHNFEEWLQNETGSSIKISDILPDGQMIEARNRPEYFPIGFVEPMSYNEFRIGLDLATDEVMQEAISRSRNTGELTASRSSIFLDQKPGIALFVPVYDEISETQAVVTGQHGGLSGYVFSVLKLENLFQQILAEANDLGFLLQISDKAGINIGHRLEENGSLKELFGTKRVFNFAGHELEVKIYPSDEILAVNSDGRRYILLIASLIAIFFAAFAAMTAATRQIATEAKVNERTEGLNRELNARREAERALRKSEVFSRSVMDSSPDCLKILSLDLKLEYISPAGLLLTESDDMSELSGLDWAEIWAHDDREIAHNAYSVARSGKEGRFQAKAPTFKGNMKWWDVTVAPIKNADGEVIKLISTSRDITHQKTLEKKLRDFNHNLEGVVDERTADLRLAQRIAQVGSWEYDHVKEDLTWSEETYRIFEKDPGYFTPSLAAFVDSVHPEDRDKVLGAYEEAAKNRTPYDIIHRLQMADGRIKFVNERCETFYDSNGRPRKSAGTLMDITKRKETENALKHEQEFRNAILESAAAGVVACDANGKLVLFNQTAKEWHGMDALSLPPEDWGRYYDIYGPDGKTPLETEDIPLVRAFNGETVVDARMSIVARGQAPRHILASGSAFFDDDGNKMGAVVMMRDITEYRNTEIERQRVLTALDGAEDGIFMFDPENLRFFYVNEGAIEQTGYSRAELLTMTPLDIKPFFDDKRFREIIKPLVNGKLSIFKYETIHRRKNGTDVNVEINLQSVLDQGGEVKLVAVVRDITQRKFIEAERQRILTALDAARDGIFMFEPDTLRYFYVNEGAVEQTGYSRVELLTMTPVDIKPEFDEQGFREAISPLLDGRLSVFNFETVHRRKDGIDVPVAISLQSVVNPDGSMQLVAVVRDITDQLRQEEDRMARAVAEEANEAKSSFLAAMSHEIRTPMNAVLGLAEVLSHSELSPYQADQVSTMRESAGHLLRLIDDILDFSKIEAGRLELDEGPVHVAEIVENIGRTLSESADKNNVIIQLFVSPEIPSWIIGDELRLRQVIYNMLGNAIKFSSGIPGRRGQVYMRLEAVQTEPMVLRITVRDNGIGIAPDKMESLFNPFTQAESVTTRRYGGTGLGLTICKRILDLMGGAISVTSTLDEGSTFTIMLPVRPAIRSEGENPGQELAGTKCCLLEGKTYIADDIQAYLEHAGAVVERGTPSMISRLGPEVIVIGEADNSITIGSGSVHRQVMVGSGRRRQPRLVDSDTVSIDANALRYADFVHAVEVAAGLASPKTVPVEMGTFTITPVDVNAERAAGRLILVVEDDPVNQKVILQQLSLLGYAAEVANNGAEALQMWREGEYILILADLHMPEMDGYALTRAIRSEEAVNDNVRHIPILALTANALRGEASHAHAVGMDDFLTKPISLDELRTVLKNRIPDHVEADRQEDAGLMQDQSGDHESAVLDVSVLKRLVGDDEGIVQETLRDYVENARKIADEIRKAVGSDIEQVGVLAHRLKSSSRSVGALALGDLCAELESAGKRSDYTVVTAHTEEFERLNAEVICEIENILEAE